MQNELEFMEWRERRSQSLVSNESYEKAALNWMNQAVYHDYSYLFSWLGEPVIQFPSDLFLIQEAIFRSGANKIIEVGIARGGTTIFLASLLKMIHGENESRVIGVDIEISSHTRRAIQNSLVNERISLVEGNSTDDEVIAKLRNYLTKEDIVLVILDSNHTQDHVYNEIKLYGDLVTTNSYLIVMDTAIEYVDEEALKGKMWSKGNSPYSAILKYQSQYPHNYELDSNLDSRSFPGAARGGYLKKNF